MTNDSSYVSLLQDETQWISIPANNPLLAPPEHLAPELVDPAPSLLNTHELEWPNFERLILRMARKVDGAFDVRLYGNPGQQQDGIDLVGFFLNEDASTYQAKRWQKFGAGDLEKAVTRYTSGGRPFDATRLVVAVATEARDTETIKKLAALRKEHSNLQIDLWDRNFISDKLRSQPAIVREFFGSPTAERFCTDAPSRTEGVGPISADAIVRGPIAHLGLEETLRSAETALANRPVEAARGFAAIADRLESSPFAGYAARLRDQQADALRSGGLIDEAVRVRLALGWNQIDAGDPFSAQVQVQKIADLDETNLPDSLIRATNSLSAAAGLRHDYAVSLNDLATAFDEMLFDDPYRTETGLVLAEEAIAARLDDLVAFRVDILTEIAKAQPATESGNRTKARLMMSIADSTDGWPELISATRTAFPPSLLAWVAARHARHLALNERPELSEDRWLDAIERACTEELYDDAGDWLYALRAVRIQYLHIQGDPNDLHRSAQALRATGRGTVLLEPSPVRARALAHLKNQKWPDALEALRQYLWRSTTVGSWSEELEAHEHLGDLFSATGSVQEAVTHFIYGGNVKKIEALAGNIPEESLHLPASFLDGAPWERSAAYAFCAKAADLLQDEDARSWGIAAAKNILSPAGQVSTLNAADPSLAAYKAFAALTPLVDERTAKAFIELSRKLIPREPNHYRFTDEPVVMALIGIGRTHPRLREEATAQLVEAVTADQRMADLVLSKAGDLLRSKKSLVSNRLASVAKEDLNAALAIAIAEADLTPIRPLARKRLEAVSTPPPREPGVQHIGIRRFPDAVLMTALGEDDQIQFAEAMIALASDPEEVPQNRQEALTALLPLAKTLPEPHRQGLFQKALRFARGEEDGDATNDFFGQTPHPLSRFRLDFGPTTLVDEGLSAAAALASTVENYGLVEAIAIERLSGASENTCYAVAHALSDIPPEQLGLDVTLLATHSSPWLRALGATVWARRPNPDHSLGERLAKDSSRHVRMSLALSLRVDKSHDRVRQILRTDPRRSIRATVQMAPSDQDVSP